VFRGSVTGFYQRAAICTDKLNAALIFKDIAAKGKKIFVTLWTGNGYYV
jgi:hypothetical protein